MGRKKTRINSEPTEDLLYLFAEGSYYHAYNIFGAHICKDGVRFTVWAPNVKSISVVGDFNDWSSRKGLDFLEPVGSTGVFSKIIKGIKKGCCYKYLIETNDGRNFFKADPFAFCAEVRPKTASKIWEFDYEWQDEKWIANRKKLNHFRQPMNIYEVHLGSWRRHPDREDEGFYTYTELAETLIPYVKSMGYTHIEILPIMEHPLDASWGYQTTGYYAATSRYGKPEELMYLIDEAHNEGIGVILDWTPGHFCRDAHGLAAFNGEKLYELREHPNWGTFEFDYGRGEVRSFLLSNAMFWLDKFHADGIRVDGVSSMLYLNFGIENEKEKRFNPDGTEGDIEAINFIKTLNKMVGTYFPECFMIAEESTSWPLVTYPPEDGGLGFHYKWDMGWMHDTLNYMKADFPYRCGCHNLITFSMMYNYNENFILPFSHDEVVHGKCSLIGRMPGDYWRQFAGLRCLMLYQITHPGAKLNFMGNELAMYIEWREWEELEWFMLGYEAHGKHKFFIKELNKFYKNEKALWDADFDPVGFKWIDADNSDQSIYVFIRKTKSGRSLLVVILNMGVQAYEKYRIGVLKEGFYEEVFNSDRDEYGGSGKLNGNSIRSEKIPFHGMPYSVEITVPPLGGSVLKLKSRT